MTTMSSPSDVRKLKAERDALLESVKELREVLIFEPMTPDQAIDVALDNADAAIALAEART